MSERLFSLILALAGTAILVLGLRLDVRFISEPFGPRKFPILLGAALTALSLYNLARPVAPRRVVLERPLLMLVAILLFYFAAFEYLGFMLSTTISVYLIARLTKSSWMEGLLAGLLIAIVFYLVFHFLLRVHLPLGRIFGVGG